MRLECTVQTAAETAARVRRTVTETVDVAPILAAVRESKGVFWLPPTGIGPRLKMRPKKRALPSGWAYMTWCDLPHCHLSELSPRLSRMRRTALLKANCRKSARVRCSGSPRAPSPRRW